MKRAQGLLGLETLPHGVKFDPADLLLILANRWFIAKDYVCTETGHRGRLYLHRMIAQPVDAQVVDHINGDRLDNRRVNLRCVTAAENHANQTRLSCRNKSGYRGVSLHRKSGLWRGIYSNKTIGYFKTPEEAHATMTRYRLDNVSGATS